MRIGTKELLQKAITGVVKQGGKSEHKSGACLYRSKVGCCAVGHLIDDQFYHADLEDVIAFDSAVVEAVEKSIERSLTPKEISYLEHLQSCHDGAQSGKHFLKRFKNEVASDSVLPKYCKEFFKGVEK